MLDKKIGFIGSGNMGRAMIGGIISSGLVPASHLIASAKTQVTLDTLSEQYGIRTTLDNETVAVESDIIFLAVKPYLYETVIKEIKDSVTDDKIIVAIAAGQTGLNLYSVKILNWFVPCQIPRLWFRKPCLPLPQMSISQKKKPKWLSLSLKALVKQKLYRKVLWMP